ncbi:protein tolQ [Pokkaliibacter plantistimulans]|uniref:Tol-Pal system protein TolQ n=2 Tax=Pseudomonadota TaxID=1224 RepID=A0ABX5M0X8_9GAMM|nr:MULTISPECIES: protein TolQ [Pokkaliibacter]MDH2431169.1 protein TolQ [Pokkaliibacter sp. MBI-7]PPC76440.1 protein TolQ [Pokkaliibacter plantistimulans]PXF32577.1 protein tolQ [Pokkaliibacter plantistimulans]
MSVWGLVSNASVLVQIVMLALLLASCLSWIVIFQRRAVLGSSRKALVEFEDRFWSGMDLSRLYREVAANQDPDNGVENIFSSGIKEFSRMRQQPGVDPEIVMQGVQRALKVAVSKEQDKLEIHLPFLATVGSVSPYIGLFGTVWGIMNAFIGLSNVQQATLATVAPGIAEALIATAIGLFAAIPAVVAYNRYSAQVDRLLNHYETFADEFSAILYRKLHTMDG